MHPLARQAAAYFASDERSYIRVRYATDELQSGKYRFSVYAWSYMGMNPHFRLMVVCDDDEVAAQLPEILQVSFSDAAPVKLEPSEWDALEMKQIKLWKKERADARD